MFQRSSIFIALTFLAVPTFAADAPTNPGRAGSSTKAAPAKGVPAAPKAVPAMTQAKAAPQVNAASQVKPVPAPISKPIAPIVATPSVATPSSDDLPAQKPRLEKFTLDYRYKAGEVLKTKVTQQTRIETTIGGTTQIAEMASVSYKSWQIKSIDKEGNITFETRWDGIDMRQKMTGRDEVRYNSATDATAPVGYEMVAAMIGKPLSTVTVDPRGKILRRIATEASTNDEKRAAQEQQQVLIPLPTESVTLGQPWSNPVDIRVSLDKGASRTIQARHRYALEKIEGNIAVIAQETILPPINEADIKAQVIQQMGRGEIRFDMKTGRVVKQVSDVDERVVGFHGADSSVYFVSKFTEEAIPSDFQVPHKPLAQKAAPVKK